MNFQKWELFSGSPGSILYNFLNNILNIEYLKRLFYIEILF